MKYLLLSILFLISAVAYTQSPACNSENHKAFDFWIGEWKVTNPDGSLAGHNSIRKIHGGCVIEENWTGAGISRGSSFNHYDPTLNKWKQKWVDNSGANIEFIGEINNDALITFAETIHPKSKARIYNKMTISKIDDNNVSQVWEQSEDQENWNEVFKGHYSRITHSVNSTLAFAVYDTFTVAYETLNPDLVSNLYHLDALYIESKDAIKKGRPAIHESFARHFQYRKDNKQTMTIEFKIIDRQESETVIADIGFFKLSIFHDDGKKTHGSGKFATVLTRDALGNWNFSSDVYHSAELEEYEKAEGINP